MKKGILAPFLLLSVLIAAYLANLLQPLDEWIRDQRFFLGDQPVSGEIVLVDIDAASINAVGVWPWKRSVYSQVIEHLNERGASVIAFDIDFSSPSDPAQDAFFAAAMAQSEAPIYLAAFNQPKNSGSDALHGNRPIDLFADFARPATVNVFADRDAIVRSFPYGAMVSGVPVQSIAAVLARYSGLLEHAFLVDFSIRIDQFDRISVVELLSGSVAPERIQGKRIIVGASAAELRDFFTVPRFGIITGHTLQAAAAETLIQNRAIQTSPALATLILIIAATGFAIAARRPASLLRTELILLAGAAGLEGAATALQVTTAFALQTAGAHIALLFYASFFIVREIDIKRILLLISESRAENTMAILDRVISDNSDGIIIVSENGEVLTINKSAELFFRKTVHPDEALPDDLIGIAVRDIAPEGLADVVEGEIAAAREGLATDSSPRLFDKDYPDQGRRVLEYVVTPSVLDGGVDMSGEQLPDKIFTYVGFRDVTQRQIREERASFLARFDQVTGLPNRNSFLEFLAGVPEGQVALADYSSICHVAISRLQGIQDAMGQDFADSILNLVATRIGETIEPVEFLAATTEGGFLLYIVATTQDQLDERLQHLLDVIATPYFHEGYGATVGANAGIAILDNLDLSPETYLKNAKSALSEAMTQDGNSFSIYAEELDRRVQLRQKLEIDLWKAFEEGQFVNFYQPQINLHDGSLYGAEALIRWIHPERGFVSPADFIPIAEQSSLIVGMGEWAMKQACQDAATWPGSAKVAVNLSPVQFFHGDLVETVEEALRMSGLTKDRLDLEITESLFMEDTSHIMELLSALRGMGLRIALDDFGTGYSSLAYIQNFPMDKIKIDQAFVRGMSEDSSSIAIVRAVAELAKGLNMQTVAEGVETDVERQLVMQVGCTVGQGYLFAKPLPAAEMKAFAEALAADK